MRNDLISDLDPFRIADAISNVRTLKCETNIVHVVIITFDINSGLC